MYQSQFRNIQPMTNDQLIEIAPSIGATQPAKRVSSKYDFVPTIQAVDLLRSAGWVPFYASQANTRKESLEGYQHHTIKFVLDNDFTAIDNVFTMDLSNSHNGLGSFSLNGGIYRLICSNGLMTCNKSYQFRHRHVGFDPKLFVESSERMSDNQKALKGQVGDMAAIELTKDEQGIFARAAHTLLNDKDGKPHPVEPEKLLYERRYDDKGNDLWSKLNVIQENIMKGGRSTYVRNENNPWRRSKKTMRKIKSIKRQEQLNKALWMMAEEMQRLKTEQV